MYFDAKEWSINVQDISLNVISGERFRSRNNLIIHLLNAFANIGFRHWKVEMIFKSNEKSGKMFCFVIAKMCIFIVNILNLFAISDMLLTITPPYIHPLLTTQK